MFVCLMGFKYADFESIKTQRKYMILRSKLMYRWCNNTEMLLRRMIMNTCIIVTKSECTFFSFGVICFFQVSYRFVAVCQVEGTIFHSK